MKPPSNVGQALSPVRSFLRRTGGSACSTLLLFGIPLGAQTIQQAEALWRAHDYVSATTAFDAALKANPKNAEYRVRFGQFFFERYYPDEAAKLFKEALELDPKNAQAYYGLARVYAEDFNPEAIAAADKALEINPKFYQAYELKARMALEDDDRKKAATEADAALAIDPTALDAIAIHATLDLLEDKQSPWLAKINNRAKGYETIASLLVINRRYEDALVYYSKAVAADPELWTAHSQLGVTLMRLGRPDEAYKELELAYNNDHTSDAATRNSLKLLDTYKDFETFTTPTTILKLNKKEADALRPYFEHVMQWATSVYEKNINSSCRGRYRLRSIRTMRTSPCARWVCRASEEFWALPSTT